MRVDEARVGRVVERRGVGDLWRLVCVRDGEHVEAVAYPWAAVWAAPRSFDLSELEVLDAG